MEAVEFKVLLKQLGRDDVTDEQIGSLFSKFDKNKDGSLSFDEYVQMYVEIHGKKGHKVAEKTVAG
jgi:Ca2+-binding EF-hand superfamily protein